MKKGEHLLQFNRPTHTDRVVEVLENLPEEGMGRSEMCRLLGMTDGHLRNSLTTATYRIHNLYEDDDGRLFLNREAM